LTKVYFDFDEQGEILFGHRCPHGPRSIGANLALVFSGISHDAELHCTCQDGVSCFQAIFCGKVVGVIKANRIFGQKILCKSHDGHELVFEPKTISNANEEEDACRQAVMLHAKTA